MMKQYKFLMTVLCHSSDTYMSFLNSGNMFEQPHVAWFYKYLIYPASELEHASLAHLMDLFLQSLYFEESAGEGFSSFSLI